MRIVFFQSTNTPLFFSSWQPTSQEGYIGACILLMVVTAITRLLYELRSRIEISQRSTRQKLSWEGDTGSHYHTAEGLKPTINDRTSSSTAKEPRNQWRVNSFWAQLSRGVWDTVLVALSYLLMLAVMTMNVGYFCSVMAGVFLGALLSNLVVGPSAARSAYWDHC
ncbi:Ctr copper transporter [Podospora australis]|uniref:Copper transport protein n=1 Tax=Podospora australis TaxID=1536484 RepID=A0AAN6WI46_9PEZI|nr:Ctr copper transporter [Podospora australis]